MFKKYLFLIFLFSTPVAMAQDEDFQVLGNSLKYENAKSSLYIYYAAQAFNFLDDRETEITQLSTSEDWMIRQEKVKTILLGVVGPFPEKSPLNPQITGTIQKEKFRLEKIVFESQPGFYVTAALFIPENLKGKTAGIIFTSGHAQEAFRWPDYQRVCINLAEKGFVVLAFDPIGQGERVQYFHPELQKSLVGDAVFEHSYVGEQCFLNGSSMARYMIWDGIRAVDYLLTRNEVDPARIGITGHSGGGTQAAYIAAFDERILAVAPECYLTNLRSLWEGIGPQDAEQSFYHGVASGLDMADLLEVRAPKPAMQITTTRDFFPIQGARETENEVKKVYHAFGKDENFYRVEDDAPHAVTKKNREARNAFFQKYLELSGDPTDKEVEFLTPEELQITETGQVLTSLGGETVFSLNKNEAQKNIDRLKKSREHSESHLQNCINSAKKLSGYQSPTKIEEETFAGRFHRNGYLIEKYIIKGEGNYPIPFLLFLPDKICAAPIVYLNPESKEEQAFANGEIEWLVKKGHPVIAPDLVGFGEMGPDLTLWGDFDSNLGSISFKHWFAPVQAAQSQVGIHAADIQRLVMYLKQRTDFDSNEIIGLAKGNSCPGLIHAAAFNKSFSHIALIEPLISYRVMVTNRYYSADVLPPVVLGALMAYDLPDLTAALAPNKLLFVDVKNQLKKPVSKMETDEDFSVIQQSYSKASAEKNLKFTTLKPQQKLIEVLAGWLE